MNNNFLILSLILSVTTAGVAASDTNTTSANETGVMVKGVGEVSLKDDPLVIDITGKEIHDVYGRAIGDVDQVVKTITGKQAVIGLYGSLKEIALPLSDLHWKEDQLFVELLEGDIDRLDDVDLGDAQELAPGEYLRNEFSRYEKRTDSQ
mgnify:CR=1 FL=1